MRKAKDRFLTSVMIRPQRLYLDSRLLLHHPPWSARRAKKGRMIILKFWNHGAGFRF